MDYKSLKFYQQLKLKNLNDKYKSIIYYILGTNLDLNTFSIHITVFERVEKQEIIKLVKG